MVTVPLTPPGLFESTISYAAGTGHRGLTPAIGAAALGTLARGSREKSVAT